jgi:hypothetical protein
MASRKKAAPAICSANTREGETLVCRELPPVSYLSAATGQAWSLDAVRINSAALCLTSGSPAFCPATPALC